MGKPYESELKILPHTYQWAISQNIEKLSRAIKNAAHLPLIAVGSGGSLSAAENMVICHQDNLGGLARAVTPLELISVLPKSNQAHVCFYSAGGGNIDIKRAFEHVLLAEAKHVTAVVGVTSSPLAELSNKYQYADLFDFDLPSGQDGFLATNSLLAFSILVCRAYDDIRTPYGSTPLPDTFDSLLNNAFPEYLALELIEENFKPVCERRTLHVLYSSGLKSVAVDIESRFIEAGLASVHLADFRNFAHGRHHWLDKNNDTSAILALSTPQDFRLAEDTLSLVPSNIPHLHIPIKSSGSLAKISGLILSTHLAGYVGRTKGIDPGRPGVPDFGVKLYNLETSSGFTTSTSLSDAAIRRKVGLPHDFISVERESAWIASYRSFREKLSAANFNGVVMDYDGTVVDSRDRYYPPNGEIVDQMLRLLRSGIMLGFATGRGKSIRNDLRKVIPEEYWNLVLVGYYNGAEISPLNDSNTPDGDSPPCTELQHALSYLLKDLEISSLANVTPRKYQITVEPKNVLPETLLFELAKNALLANNQSNYDIFRSSHSVDILAKGVSKLSVIQTVMDKLGEEAGVLTIGDRGKWPGNDFELLKHIYSLSVDEVSPCPQSCWNLCPPGVLGPQGTLYYLKKLQVTNRSTATVKLIFGDQ